MTETSIDCASSRVANFAVLRTTARGPVLGEAYVEAAAPKMSKAEIIQRTEHEVALWKQWIADKHRLGQHGYDPFLQRIEAKCAKRPALTHPEHFKPLGSSAATASYGLSG